MECHYQTEKRTFVVVQGVCIRVMTNKGENDENHGAIGCSLLGGVQEIFRPEMSPLPEVGQHLVFKLSTGSGRNKLFSDTKIRKISERKITVMITTMTRTSRQTLPGV